MTSSNWCIHDHVTSHLMVSVNKEASTKCQEKEVFEVFFPVYHVYFFEFLCAMIELEGFLKITAGALEGVKYWGDQSNKFLPKG